MYSVLNTYIFTYRKTFIFLLVFKITESLQCILNDKRIPNVSNWKLSKRTLTVHSTIYVQIHVSYEQKNYLISCGIKRTVALCNSTTLIKYQNTQHLINFSRKFQPFKS